jgi:2-polyprenyl-3-methyl-5-hydroxy-6-metoxy-1,4-benzoquinol methylase
MATDELNGLRRDWEELATLDALWAINSWRDKKYSKWTIEEFLETGVAEVQRILIDSRRLDRPRAHHAALDFGCGIGRLSRHLAAHFETVEGVDISEQMVAIGRRVNRNVRNLTFSVNTDPNLQAFASESFDMVCSIIVLQHLPDPRIIEGYLVEFIRLLKPEGLIAFQLPTALPKVRLLLARRTPYIVLRRIGFRPDFLYFRLGLHPMRMTALPARRVTECIRQAGGTVLDVVPVGKQNNLYYVTH